MTEIDSLLIGINGPRGGGKTLLLSYFGCKALADGVPVWANYKIRFTNEKKQYEAMPLNLNELFTFSPAFQDGIILIDEMQYIADSMRSSSNANKLLDSFVMQLRKRRLHLIYTTKFPEWIDKRIRYETDCNIECMDICFTPWGRQKGIGKGEYFNISARDMSGILTGYSWYRSPQTFTTMFYGKKIWPYFDSYEIIDVFEASRPVEMALNKRRITEDALTPVVDFSESIQQLFHDTDRRTQAETFALIGAETRADKTRAKEQLALQGIIEKGRSGVRCFEKV